MNIFNNLRVKYRLMLFPLFLFLMLACIYGVFKRESILADKRLMQNEIIMEVQIKFLRGGQLFYQNNRTQEAYKTFIATIHEMIA
ncbi:MAG: methyl-accepting chemotaxis protein, partial [Helicobacter sp.]|nr:methyl-accepting chemotaxis protein [Helicobacter sp.]